MCITSVLHKRGVRTYEVVCAHLRAHFCVHVCAHVCERVCAHVRTGFAGHLLRDVGHTKVGARVDVEASTVLVAGVETERYCHLLSSTRLKPCGAVC